MKKFIRSNGLYVIAALLMFVYAFSNRGDKLAPKAFSQKIKTTAGAQVVDVRTPEEFSEGYIKGAVNIDWTGDGFEAKVSKLDKNKPAFVYCRSGKRSSAAANKMRSLGFKEVYDLDGGILEWESENLPLTGIGK